MRTLILGAGALGGYFGGRLLAAGRDVTFLVRPARAALLAAHGLNVLSPACGDLHLPAPATIEAATGPYDLILLSAKAYDLPSALDAIAPAVGPQTAIVPLLNGMAHLDALDARFGPACVLGGTSVISAALAPDGTIHHLNARDLVFFGNRDAARTHPQIAQVEATRPMPGLPPRCARTSPRTCGISGPFWPRSQASPACSAPTSVRSPPPVQRRLRLRSMGNA